MLSRGFPAEGNSAEYTSYFEKIFGEDKEKQRQYLRAILSEDNVTLSVGNRVLGALLGMAQCRAIFTTNFDSVMERAVAEVSRRSLSAYHLEGARSANKALNNEEYPLYCKLHGDFRYDSIKNLSADLASQNADLSQCLANAANRFGLIVAGYSGRDESIMGLLWSALATPNPFPHGLFWTVMKGGRVLPAVQQLIDGAKQVGVDAALVEIETFDAFMLRLWRNLERKDPDIDARVRKTEMATVSIPLPTAGRGAIVRMNALPVTSMPGECQALTFTSSNEWSDLAPQPETRKVRLSSQSLKRFFAGAKNQLSEGSSQTSCRCQFMTFRPKSPILKTICILRAFLKRPFATRSFAASPC